MKRNNPFLNFLLMIVLMIFFAFAMSSYDPELNSSQKETVISFFDGNDISCSKENDETIVIINKSNSSYNKYTSIFDKNDDTFNIKNCFILKKAK